MTSRPGLHPPLRVPWDESSHFGVMQPYAVLVLTVNMMTDVTVMSIKISGPGLQPGGFKVVYRHVGNGSRACVFRGTLDDWLVWTPPEILRDDSRMAKWPTIKVEQ